MTKKHASVITVLSVAAIALALLLSSRLWFRLDMTAGKLYTISQVSRHLADEIPDQVKISYFLSGKLQQLYPEPGEIIDLIREYAAYSRGKINFTTRDPAKDGIENDMQRLGIYPRQIQSIDRNEATVTSVYSGILIEYMDKVDVIPFIFSLETLEYDLTSRIRTLVSGKIREAGVIIADQSKALNRNYRNMGEILRMSGYKLREIYPDELMGDEIPAGLSEIIVIGGVDTLNEGMLYGIDRYIQSGGKVFFMLETFTPATETGSLEMRTLEDAGLLAMLRSYGVEVQRALVLDNSCLTITYQSAGAGGAPVIRLIRYPFWVSVTRAGGNPAHPITSAFAGVDMFWPNPLVLHETAGVEAVPLIFSTQDAWLMTKDISVNPDSAFMFTRENRETQGQKLLGAALSGRFPPYSGIPDINSSGEAASTAGTGSPDNGAESRIVVIGNGEFLNDEYLDSERNLTFFLSAADWLANDDDIISIRSRAAGINRLDKIIDSEKRDAAMTFARLLNTMAIPAAVLIFAVVFGIKRRKKTIG
ncbi:MAG: GldG family protein [Spirochaetaceae bacterium]|jgi:ABC-type uncharacterized transport system involved in gliding motility auxiliary subunit|nr:GldG family protein [Spirochaetaceae bacterium]